MELAELVVEGDVFPAVLLELKGDLYSSARHMTCHVISADSDEYVRKNVATLIREIVHHTPEVGPAPQPHPHSLSPMCIAGSAGG